MEQINTDSKHVDKTGNTNSSLLLKDILKDSKPVRDNAASSTKEKRKLAELNAVRASNDKDEAESMLPFVPEKLRRNIIRDILDEKTSR